MTDKANIPYLLGKALGFMRIGEANSNRTKSGSQTSDLVNTRVSARLRKGAKRIGRYFPKIRQDYESLDRGKAGDTCNRMIREYLDQLGSELPAVMSELEQASFWLGYSATESEYWRLIEEAKKNKDAKKANESNGDSKTESTPEATQLTLSGDYNDEI